MRAGKRRAQFLTSMEVREHLRQLWDKEGPLLRLIWAAGQRALRGRPLHCSPSSRSVGQPVLLWVACQEGPL